MSTVYKQNPVRIGAVGLLFYASVAVNALFILHVKALLYRVSLSVLIGAYKLQTANYKRCLSYEVHIMDYGPYMHAFYQMHVEYQETHNQDM